MVLLPQNDLRDSEVGSEDEGDDIGTEDEVELDDEGDQSSLGSEEEGDENEGDEGEDEGDEDEEDVPVQKNQKNFGSVLDRLLSKDVKGEVSVLGNLKKRKNEEDSEVALRRLHTNILQCF